MHNLVPARFLNRRSYDWMLIASLIMAIGLIAVLIAVALFAIPLQVPTNPSYPLYNTFRTALAVLGLPVLLVGIGLLVRAVTWRRDNVLAKEVGDRLSAQLDSRYTYIRNVSHIRIGYVDAVLIGLEGLLVFRVHDREGVLFNEGVEWMAKKDDGEWLALTWNPTKEVIADIQKLRDFLKPRMGDMPVFGVIVFTQDSPTTQVSQQEPLVPATNIPDFRQKLAASYFARSRITPQQQEELVKLFLNE